MNAKDNGGPSEMMEQQQLPIYNVSQDDFDRESLDVGAGSPANVCP